MKIKYTITLLTLIAIHFSSLAQNKNVTNKGINWMSVEEVQEKMKVEPRKVYVDVYTDWCGWCKVMDKKTFTNKQLIEYINQNYYAIHLNAEGKDSILFNNKKYGPLQGGKTSELAADWMMNKLSYPTSIFFDLNFRNPQPIPGYLEVPMMEMILKYFGENKHKSIPWEKYKKEFVATWK